MAPANFHRYCKHKDRIHFLYVFSILTPFIRCINYTCRHNISREIYFCTNSTLRRLGKMVGRNVEMRMKSGLTLRLALYSAEVQQTFMLTYVLAMSFSTVCRWVRKFSATVGPVTSAPESGISKSASSLKIVEIFFSKTDARYTSQLIADMFGISKASSLRFW